MAPSNPCAEVYEYTEKQLRLLRYGQVTRQTLNAYCLEHNIPEPFDIRADVDMDAIIVECICGWKQAESHRAIRQAYIQNLPLHVWMDHYHKCAHAQVILGREGGVLDVVTGERA